jgi:hypothetical protein
MGFVELSLLDDARREQELGRYKLWVRIRNRWELGERGAELHLYSFIRTMKGYHDPRVLSCIAGAKISTDAQAILVVYLDESILEYLDDRRVRLLASAMGLWAGATQARVGFSKVAYSPTLAILEAWVGEDADKNVGLD